MSAVDDELMADHRSLRVAEQLSPDLMLLKLENSEIMAVARAKPRDNGLIIKQLRSLLDAYPESAHGAIYCKPVGRVTQIVCGNRQCGRMYEVAKITKETCCDRCGAKDQAEVRPGVMKYAENLSIRAAESIRSTYGFTRLETRAEPMEDERVKLTGIFVDYCAGNITIDGRIVSPYYKSAGGGMTKTPEDRFLNIVVKAEKSKLRRDVILDTVPAEIKMAYRDMCEKKLDTLVTQEYIDKKVIPQFVAKGLKIDQIEALVGKPMKAGWIKDDIMKLHKIWMAVESEEVSIRELLSNLEEAQPTQTTNGGGAVSGEVLAGAKAKKEADKPSGDQTPKAEDKKEDPPVEWPKDMEEVSVLLGGKTDVKSVTELQKRVIDQWGGEWAPAALAEWNRRCNARCTELKPTGKASQKRMM